MDQPGFLFTVLMFVAMIGPLVFIHEYGHYIAGRMFGIKADHFSIGFGKELFGWTDRQGTRWKVSALPLGGYVRFAGDMNAASVADPRIQALPPEERAHTFVAKPRWQRAIVVAAGPATNFLFAIAIFAVFIGIYGHGYTPAVVEQVVPGSPAAATGLQRGDRILKIDGRTVERFEDILQVVVLHPGESIAMTYERGGRTVETRITPSRIEERDRFGNQYFVGRIGVQRPSTVVVQRDPLEAVYYATQEVWMMTRSMADTLVQVVTGRRSVKELGGPLKIAQYSGQQATLGVASFVALMALISINLGFINLLPVPMLDGGHLLIYAIESITQQTLNPKVLEYAFMSGFALLISLMVLLTFNDLASFGLFEHLAGLLG